MDKVDSFDKIKFEILDSDVVILGSPVYAAAVSGDMKTFIDRLSSWLHLMPLSGKLGVMLITASSNSLMETGSYLRRIMESFGLIMAGEVLCTSDAPRMLDNPQFRETTLRREASKLTDCLNGKKIEPSAYQGKYFKMLQSAYNMPGEDQNAEVAYWKNSGLLEYADYSDYLNHIRHEGR
jgi:multimeric flavodoxin WrbA